MYVFTYICTYTCVEHVRVNTRCEFFVLARVQLLLCPRWVLCTHCNLTFVCTHTNVYKKWSKRFLCICAVAYILNTVHPIWYTNTHSCIYIYLPTYVCSRSLLPEGCVDVFCERDLNCKEAYLSISRLLKIIGLFCKRAICKILYSAKVTYNLRSLLICAVACCCLKVVWMFLALVPLDLTK